MAVTWLPGNPPWVVISVGNQDSLGSKVVKQADHLMIGVLYDIGDKQCRDILGWRLAEFAENRIIFILYFPT